MTDLALLLISLKTVVAFVVGVMSGIMPTLLLGLVTGVGWLALLRYLR